MQSYNLDQDTQESFKFEVGGYTYEMRYPTTEEMLEMQGRVNTKKLSGIEQLRETYAYISPVTDGAPSIEDVMKGKNVKVLKNFNKMIQAEFLSED